MLGTWLLLNAGANKVVHGSFTVTFVMPYPDSGSRLWLVSAEGRGAEGRSMRRTCPTLVLELVRAGSH